MAGKQDKISNTCQESCSLYIHSIAQVLPYVFVRESLKLEHHQSGLIKIQLHINKVHSNVFLNLC